MTVRELMAMVVRALHDDKMPPQEREFALRAGRNGGLLGGDNRPLPLYFALLNDEFEIMSSDLEGYHPNPRGRCACGCGRILKGRAVYATKNCWKKANGPQSL